LGTRTYFCSALQSAVVLLFAIEIIIIVIILFTVTRCSSYYIFGTKLKSSLSREDSLTDLYFLFLIYRYVHQLIRKKNIFWFGTSDTLRGISSAIYRLDVIATYRTTKTRESTTIVTLVNTHADFEYKRCVVSRIKIIVSDRPNRGGTTRYIYYRKRWEFWNCRYILSLFTMTRKVRQCWIFRSLINISTFPYYIRQCHKSA
jgi:hypothetical protein